MRPPNRGVPRPAGSTALTICRSTLNCCKISGVLRMFQALS